MRETDKHRHFQEVIENAGWGPVKAKLLTDRTSVSQNCRTQQGVERMARVLEDEPVVLMVGHHDMVDMVRLSHAMLSLDLPIANALVPVAFASFEKKIFQELNSEIEEAVEQSEANVELQPVFRTYEYGLYKAGFYSKEQREQGFAYTKAYKKKVKALMNVEDLETAGNIVALAPGAGVRRRGQTDILNQGVGELLSEDRAIFFAALDWVPHGVLGWLNAEVVMHPTEIRVPTGTTHEEKSKLVDKVMYELEGDINEESWLKRSFVLGTQKMIDIWSWERRAKALIGRAAALLPGNKLENISNSGKQ